MDRVAEFFEEKTPRRAVALGAFVGIIYLFRELLPLFVFFVAFERALGFVRGQLVLRAKLGPKIALAVTLLVTLGLLAIAVALGVGRAIHGLTHLRADFPDKLQRLKEQPLYARVREQVGDPDRLVDGAKHYAAEAMHAASAVGHILVFTTIGFILAVVFLLEKEHVDEMQHKLAARSLLGTLFRWLGYLADATVVTVELQLVVAAVNAILTLPLMLALGVPHIPALLVLIFVAALIPVVGNFVSGAVLCLFAYQVKGWGGVTAFVILTVLLHKLESYYLNPRLTSRHVKLPGFVLIVSLLAWEHLLGFVGLFVSFPVLFVASKIRAEMLAQNAQDAQNDPMAPASTDP